MPQVFKALASITAWVLFICGMVMGFSTFAMGVIHGDLFGAEELSMGYPVSFAVAGFYAIAAVVVMVLRKKME